MSTLEPIAGINPIDPFDAWLTDRPKWLQTAASEMLAKRALPDPGDVEALSNLCMEEAGGADKDKDKDKFKSLGSGALGAAQKRPHLHLVGPECVNQFETPGLNF